MSYSNIKKISCQFCPGRNIERQNIKNLNLPNYLDDGKTATEVFIDGNHKLILGSNCLQIIHDNKKKELREMTKKNEEWKRKQIEEGSGLFLNVFNSQVEKCKNELFYLECKLKELLFSC